MNRVVRAEEKGFTIIELMLAMSFISILLLTIALTIVQIGTIYNRGTVARDVNQVSRDVSSQFEQSMKANGEFSLAAADHQYVSSAWGGRLCVGGYAYIWNYASALNPSSPNANRNKFVNPTARSATNTVTLGGVTQHEISLVKIEDAGAMYCTPSTGGAYPNVDQTKANELLRSGDRSLMLHYLTIVSSATATDAVSAQQLYKLTFVLGTSDTNALTGTGANVVCKAPGETGADANYCNVQKFSLVLRVAGGVN